MKLTTTTNQEFSLVAQTGYVTVLAFLSSEDTVSPEYVAFLNSLRKHYPASKLRIAGFLLNRSGADPKSLFTKNPPTFPLVANFPKGYLRELTNAIFAPYVLSVPSNVLLDKSGMMVWRSGGWTRNTEAKTKEQLKSLLEAESKEKPLGSD